MEGDRGGVAGRLIKSGQHRTPDKVALVGTPRRRPAARCGIGAKSGSVCEQPLRPRAEGPGRGSSSRPRSRRCGCSSSSSPRLQVSVKSSTCDDDPRVPHALGEGRTRYNSASRKRVRRSSDRSSPPSAWARSRRRNGGHRARLAYRRPWRGDQDRVRDHQVASVSANAARDDRVNRVAAATHVDVQTLREGRGAAAKRISALRGSRCFGGGTCA